MRLRPLASLLTLILLGCRAYEFSPYETRVGGDERNLNARNIARFQAESPGRGPLVFAVVSDPQGSYDELREAVGLINADSTIRLVIMAGDMTQTGLRQEFEWIEGLLASLKAPHLCVIGNHDARSNGAGIFRSMYGPFDFAFVNGGRRFVFYNANAWQFKRGAPDLPWIASELDSAGDSLSILTCSHIKPYGDQLDSATSKELVDMFQSHHVFLSLHGHQSNYHFGKLMGGDVTYLIADDMKDRNWLKVTLTDTVKVERIFY